MWIYLFLLLKAVGTSQKVLSPLVLLASLRRRSSHRRKDDVDH